MPLLGQAARAGTACEPSRLSFLPHRSPCPDAGEEAAALCRERTAELSALVNEFILRRTNTQGVS